MTKETKSPGEPVVIKRYASRKLYDADAKEYVTIEDIARYVREGRDVQIIDKNTGEDLTRQYLVQIIADFESQGESALPINILTDLVRHYQEQASAMTTNLAGAMTPAFLGQMFETFKAQQEKAMGEWSRLSAGSMDPEKMMQTMGSAFQQAMLENMQAGMQASIKAGLKDWQDRQGEFMSQAMRQWGFAGKPHEQTSRTSSVDDAEKDARIRALEEHLKTLQNELSKLR